MPHVTACAGTSSFLNFRSRVAQASEITVQAKPISFAARTVVSMHMWLIAPQMTSFVTSASFSRERSSVWKKLFGKFFSMTVSPAKGLDAGIDICSGGSGYEEGSSGSGRQVPDKENWLACGTKRFQEGSCFFWWHLPYLQVPSSLRGSSHSGCQ